MFCRCCVQRLSCWWRWGGKQTEISQDGGGLLSSEGEGQKLLGEGEALVQPVRQRVQWRDDSSQPASSNLSKPFINYQPLPIARYCISCMYFAIARICPVCCTVMVDPYHRHHHPVPPLITISSHLVSSPSSTAQRTPRPKHRDTPAAQLTRQCTPPPSRLATSTPRSLTHKTTQTETVQPCQSSGVTSFDSLVAWLSGRQWLPKVSRATAHQKILITTHYLLGTCLCVVV